MSFSIRLSNEEKALAESYAKIHNLSLKEAFKNALFEKIEDEYDLKIAKEAHDEYIKSGKKTDLSVNFKMSLIYDLSCRNYYPLW